MSNNYQTNQELDQSAISNGVESILSAHIPSHIWAKYIKIALAYINYGRKQMQMMPGCNYFFHFHNHLLIGCILLISLNENMDIA